MKDLAFDAVRSEVSYLGRVPRFARGATPQFLFVLIGLPGMILAPVVLNYVRMEASRIEAKPQLDPSGNPV